jgi:hypothetical protein
MVRTAKILIIAVLISGRFIERPHEKHAATGAKIKQQKKEKAASCRPDTIGEQ